MDQAGMKTAVHIESADTNPYPTIEPIPYDPNDPVFTEPVTPAPEPEREHLTAEEAIARQEEAAAAESDA